jgi:hypothetical protein
MENTRDIALHQSETAFISLVFAVFACAARLVDDPRLSTGGDQEDGGMGMVYYERSLNVLAIPLECYSPTLL